MLRVWPVGCTRGFHMKHPMLAVLLLVAPLAGCSGSTQTTVHGGDGGAGTDSGEVGDTGADVVSPPGDAGGSCRTEPPTTHRPSASTCSSHETDAGVDSGFVGCMPPHDACLVDSDCGSTGVCDCETPRCTEPFAVAGNVCLPSNCRIDSDCACGFCAGEPSCGGIDAYYCTTPHDECSTDADCQDGGMFTQCRWSTDRWACVEGMGCPG
jgi:hypothetical protein